MKLEVTTSIKSAEMANFLIGQAIKSARNNRVFMRHYSLTENDLLAGERFRKSLVKSILNKAKET